jgi:hypothetical protein
MIYAPYFGCVVRNICGGWHATSNICLKAGTEAGIYICGNDERKMQKKMQRMLGCIDRS